MTRDPVESVPVTLQRRVAVTIDDQDVTVPEGSTILDACRTLGTEVPTLCFGETLIPKNACRVCVVELEGSRVLVPACSRRAEDGMVIRTGTERARHSRRLVLELLGSSVDLSTTANVERWNAEYGADPTLSTAYVQFVCTTLKPLIDVTYRTKPEAGGHPQKLAPAYGAADVLVRNILTLQRHYAISSLRFRQRSTWPAPRRQPYPSRPSDGSMDN